MTEPRRLKQRTRWIPPDGKRAEDVTLYIIKLKERKREEEEGGAPSNLSPFSVGY